MALWLHSDKQTLNNLTTMKIRNHREYTIAYEKAAFMIDAGFGGSFEREKYFREIISAIMEYEKEAPTLMFQPQVVSMSA
jgi:hypothetical protein